MKEITLEKYEERIIGKELSDISTEKLEKIYADLDSRTKQESWNLYCDYNIKDVELVKKLDDKLAFIGLVQVQAYICKVPLGKVKSSIRKFDNYLISTLKEHKIVLPTTKRQSSEEIIGGYVSEPQKGFFPYNVSFDFTSLYPHIIFALNLSPETYVGMILDDVGQKFTTLDLEQMHDDSEYLIVDRNKTEKSVKGSKLKKWIKKKRFILAPNGLIFKSEEGFIPKVVQEVFQKRKEYKKIMQKYGKAFEKSKDPKDKDLEHKYHLYQYAMKIFANSIYGIMANEHFRLFNPDFARAITLTGRKVIQYTAEEFNGFFKEKYDIDYNVCIYSDTDSIYVNYSPMIDSEGLNSDTLIDGINNFNSTKIEPFLDDIFNHFSKDLMNVDKNWFDLKRESISLGSIFIQKKKYVCRVIDDEGNTYAKPKLKAKGMEIVRSSTPSFCREKIKDVVNSMIDNMDKKKVIADVRDIRDEFYEQDIVDIAFPRGIKAMNKWMGKRGDILPRCPIHVRSAINYNKLLRRYEVEGKYEEIHQGTKIKFIYINPSNQILNGQNIMGFMDVLPDEFNLKQHIDMDTQFEKSFMSPIKTLFEAVGWGVPNIICNDIADEFF